MKRGLAFNSCGAVESDVQLLVDSLDDTSPNATLTPAESAEEIHNALSALDSVVSRIL